ncbi:MAG: hypothetical protein V4633_08285 [Pseudomonadota bacterium]
MKSTGFWITRFAMALASTFTFLFVIYALQGQPLKSAAQDALMWAILATSIFIAGRYYNASKGRACALCRDTVEDAPAN